MNKAAIPIEQSEEQSNLKESAIYVGKSLGGLILGAATGYAISKGVQEIIPIDNDSLASVYETAGTGMWALMGVSLANITSR